MNIATMYLTIQGKEDPHKREFSIGCVAGARYASAEVEKTRRELDEQIKKEGRYSSATMTNPSFFRITRDRLTQSNSFEVQGSMTGGEAEVVVIRTGGELFISVGSDNCDRELDPLFPDKPKQMCPHTVAGSAWPYEEVRDHWDKLRIYSEVTYNSQVITLQDSPLSELVSVDYLLGMDVVKELPDPMFLYGGATAFLPSAAEQVKRLGLPEMTSHGVGDSFLVRLIDPVLGRSIEHTYSAVPVGDDYNERKGRGEALTPHH